MIKKAKTILKKNPTKTHTHTKKNPQNQMDRQNPRTNGKSKKDQKI